MLASIRVELIKLKRSKIMLVAVAGPALVALLFFSLQASGASLRAWPLYLFAGITAWATFMMPLTATIIATLLAQLEEGRTMPASALAEYHGLSPSYLLKHLKTLAAAGILESVSGPHGGYRLALSADAITLLDVVLAIEGPKPAFRWSWSVG